MATAAERVFDCGAADTTRTCDISPPAARSTLELTGLQIARLRHDGAGRCEDHRQSWPKCRHRDRIKIRELPERVDGCEDCLAAGQPWLHLRICLECGHVGCCDQSPHRHATAHANSTGHPIIRSLEPGEEWGWCYIDRIGMLAPEVSGSTRIPPSPLRP